MMLHVLIAMVAGWLQRHQQQVMSYLIEENRVLKAHLGAQQLRLTDTERWVVFLQPAAKYKRSAWRPSQGQKGIDQRALIASR
jgi:hypothetical protein